MYNIYLHYVFMAFLLIFVFSGCTDRRMTDFVVASPTTTTAVDISNNTTTKQTYFISDYSFEVPEFLEVQTRHPEIVIFQNTVDLVGNSRVTPNALTVTTSKGQLRTLECVVESAQPVTSDVFNRYEERRCPNTYNPAGQSSVYYFAKSYTYTTLYMEFHVDGGGQALLFEEVLRSSAQRR